MVDVPRILQLVQQIVRRTCHFHSYIQWHNFFNPCPILQIDLDILRYILWKILAFFIFEVETLTFLLIKVWHVWWDSCFCIFHELFFHESNFDLKKNELLSGIERSWNWQSRIHKHQPFFFPNSAGPEHGRGVWPPGAPTLEGPQIKTWIIGTLASAKENWKNLFAFHSFWHTSYPHPVQTFFLLQLLIRIVLYDSHVPQLQIKIVVDQVHDVKIRIHVHPKIPNINMVSCSHPRSFCSTENMNFGGNIFVCKHSIYKRTVVSYIHTAPAYADPHQILWVWVYKATKYLTR